MAIAPSIRPRTLLASVLFENRRRNRVTVRPILRTDNEFLAGPFLYFLKDHESLLSPTTFADLSPVESYHPGKDSTYASRSSRRYARRPFMLKALICPRSVIFLSVSSQI